MVKTGDSEVPHRQIRAIYDDQTITVYQAYSASIAVQAVREQKLNASPDFLLGRMTWIKPSWCWMMYRSGYSTKDDRQSHILAIKMTHQNFKKLLSQAMVVTGTSLTASERAKPVRVQWDPERTPSLGVLPYRSIQIGISQALSQTWVEQWIESIEDVTENALGLMNAVKEDPRVPLEVLKAKGFVPEEKVYEVPKELQQTLMIT
ncbi:MAG: hypothetical protein M1840_004350 [Geoglossum simile]|nr:MAG: hypothetical protein M1840_004350 [Geoglossum simile]